MRRFFLPKSNFIEIDQVVPDCWIKVVCPIQEDLDFLIEEIGVPESFLADTADRDERPRVEMEDDWQLTIIRVPTETLEASTPYSTMPVGIIYSAEKKVVVTICYHRSQFMQDFIDHNRRKKISVQTETDFILRLILCSAVWFLKYIKQISSMVMEAEEALEKSIRNEDLLQMMKLQKCFVYFNTSIRGNESVMGKIRALRYNNYDEELAEDVAIELNQAYNMVNVYSDILTGTMDAFASIISNNVNTIMKRMTSISIVLMLPTLIASLYGMNVKLAFADKSWAFIGILMLSLLLSAGAFTYFKRIKWF